MFTWSTAIQQTTSSNANPITLLLIMIAGVEWFSILHRHLYLYEIFVIHISYIICSQKWASKQKFIRKHLVCKYAQVAPY